jgi:hypothetical protein
LCFLNTENISAFVGFSWKIGIEMHGATMKKIYDNLQKATCFKHMVFNSTTTNGIL